MIIDSLASRRGVLHPAADALLARCEPAIMAGTLPDWAEEEARAVYPQLGRGPADRCSWEDADHMASVAALWACRALKTPRPFEMEAADVQILLDEAGAPVEDMLRAFRRHYPGGYLD